MDGTAPSIAYRTPTPGPSPSNRSTMTPTSQCSLQPPLTPKAHPTSQQHVSPQERLSSSCCPQPTTPGSFLPASPGASLCECSPLPQETWTDLPATMIDSLDLNALRQKLSLANTLLKSLSVSLATMRTTAAHYLLQHKLLQLETSEAAARHQVESDITKREVEVLRLDPSSTWPSSQQAALVEENEIYKRRLRKAKRNIREHREELMELRDENQRLKKRIRDNRQHQLEASRSPADHELTRVRRSAAINGTSERARSTDGKSGGEEGDGLAALGFLASQVLSQEIGGGSRNRDRNTCRDGDDDNDNSNNNTAVPNTPPPHHHHHHYSQNNPKQPLAGRPGLLSPVAFTTSQKRTRSRDSTISASEGEDHPPPPPPPPSLQLPLSSSSSFSSSKIKPAKKMHKSPPTRRRRKKFRHNTPPPKHQYQHQPPPPSISISLPPPPTSPPAAQVEEEEVEEQEARYRRLPPGTPISPPLQRGGLRVKKMGTPNGSGTSGGGGRVRNGNRTKNKLFNPPISFPTSSNSNSNSTPTPTSAPSFTVAGIGSTPPSV